MKLTGAERHRTQKWTGKLILQVQVEDVVYEPCGPSVDCRTVRYWRDARTEDVTVNKCLDVKR